MIARYSTPETDQLFSEVGKMQRWLEIELCVVEELAAEGIVPKEAATACRTHAPVIDEEFVAKVEEREAITNHDVAAFVDVVQAAIGSHGTWIHYGLTSTDVVDTGLCWALRDASQHIDDALTTLVNTTLTIATQHRNTPMMGRTHGIHAEPTTFGAKIALFGLQLVRDRERLRRSMENISVCKLSGAVGTYSNITPETEARVASRLRLVPVPATQVIARDRHAEFLYACASLGTTLETIAVELRHLQRTEVNEVQEGFSAGQKGSSAMPHKKNPISSETITGLSRVLRGNAQVGLQDVALWHERDISHSSAERIVLPDSASLALYMVRRMNRILSNLQVNDQNMLNNIEKLNGAVFSQSVLLRMVENGMSRDDAYRIVQTAANTSFETGTHLRDVLSKNSEVTLTAAQLDDAFNLERVLQHAGRSVDALRSAIG